MIRFEESLRGQMVPAGDIKPHPDNYNNGDVDEIEQSLILDGCYRPIYASKRTGHILAGHHLYEALLRQGLREVPVSWIDTDEAGELRIIAKDNQIARLARPDPGLLLKMLKKVAAGEHGLAGTGFNEDHMLELLNHNAGGFSAPPPPPPPASLEALDALTVLGDVMRSLKALLAEADRDPEWYAGVLAAKSEVEDIISARSGIQEDE